MNEEKTLIGLAGNAGAGKDYTYDRLRRYLKDRAVIRVALADEVRFEVQETLLEGLDIGRLPAVWDKPYPTEVRALLQWWGTELRRAQDEDYWVNKAAETIDGIFREGPALVVVTDVRFENEADMVHDLGGHVFEVTAPKEVREKRIGTLPPAHASEVIDFPTDGYIKNGKYFSIGPSALNAVPGMEPTCLPCSFLHVHRYHDHGDVNPLWEVQDFYANA